MSNQNKSIRIKINPADPSNIYINQKIIQDHENIQVLSLTLKQSDLYKTFSSPVGCLIGRVSSSNVGIPNVKISVFISIDPNETRSEILSIYPFKTPTDKDSKGMRYNLLNKLKRLSPFSGFKENPYGVGYKPKTAFLGSQVDKPELISNDTYIEVYENYYKYTTVTNDSGDYFLLGINIGTQIVHMECNLEDVGKWSSSPAILSQMQGLGASSDAFTNDGTKVKQTNDLDSVPTIQSQNIGVTIIPLWGSDDTVGFTRQDFELRVKPVPFFSVLGSGFTMGENGSWLDRVIFRGYFFMKNLCLSVGNCDSVSDAPGVTLQIGLKYRIKIGGKTIASGCAGNCNGCSPDATFSLCFCLKIVIANILPAIKISSIGISRCKILGDTFSDGPVVLKWLGSTSSCSCNSTNISTCGAENFADEFTEELNLSSHRVGEINERIFTYKSTTSDDDIYSFNTDIYNDIVLLQPNEYAKIKSPNGTFFYQIPCNRNRVITSPEGIEILTDDPTQGLPTAMNGYFIFSMDNLPIDKGGNRLGVDRVRIKVPSCQDYNDSTFVQSSYNFEANNIYTTSMLMSVANKTQPEEMTGLITQVNTFNQVDDTLYSEDMNLIENDSRNLFSVPNNRIFIQEWLNGSLYFLQAGYKNRRGKKKDLSCGLITGNNQVRTRHDNRPLGGSVVDSYFILNNETYQTNFISLNKDALIDTIIPSTYRGIKFNTDPNKFLMNDNNTGTKYFYRGLLDNADSITNMIQKDII